MAHNDTLLFSLDLEDHTGVYATSGRYIDNAKKILDFLDELGVVGTMFTVGKVADAAPELVREVARRGHEVACHSYDHTPVDRLGQARFADDLRRAKDVLEQCISGQVTGFRAPMFSLTQNTPWAPDALLEAGIRYSSSVMPARNPIYGFDGAPRSVFRWRNGLLELPCPIASIAGMNVAYLGGVYLRYIPNFVVSKLLSRREENTVRWTYIHPYDFDPDEPFQRVDGAAFVTSVIVWLNRKRTYDKMRVLYRNHRSDRFTDYIAQHNLNQAASVFEWPGEEKLSA